MPPPSGAPEVVRLDREDFVDNYWDYRSGEHVTFIGRTGSGKTTLANQLLAATAHPKLPAAVLVMKPRDLTVKAFQKTTGYVKVASWPPVRSLWRPAKPSGYIVWPRHNFRDPVATNYNHAELFAKVMMDCYKRGNYIVFGDELYSLSEELKLDPELICLWTKGRSMGTGLWGATQKPTHVPLWAYNQASHMFLAFEHEKRARDRFGEIGGVDPDLVKRAVLTLDDHEWLYIHQKGRSSEVCIIGP